MRKKKDTKFFIHLALIGCSVVFALPFIWVLVTSMKPVEQTMTIPPTWIPKTYHVQVEGKQLEVKKGIITQERGAIVIVREGPRKGERLFVHQSQLKEDRALLQVQVADRIFEDYYDVKVEKEVGAGWVQVVEKTTKQYIKER